MIISRQYADRLIRQGKAKAEGTTTTDDGERMLILTRYDIQRTDHTEAKKTDSKYNGIAEYMQDKYPEVFGII